MKVTAIVPNTVSVHLTDPGRAACELPAIFEAKAWRISRFELRAHTITDLVPGREYAVRVIASSNTYGEMPDRSMSTWSTHYFEQQKELRGKQKLASKLRPAAIGATLAVLGRIVVMPVMLMTIFGVTGYLSDGTFLIEYKDSYFAYSQMDLVMSGGCTPCHVICKRVLHQMATFNHEALMSKPTFEDLYTATSWDYSILSAEALALADRLDASGAICSGGVDEWGSPLSIITGEAEEVVEIIDTLNLSVTPLEYAELKKGHVPLGS
ncbi:hypothetical protein BBO99_00005267 [Phytophthora kernoviae]|uniref:Fibronectin type-III domain-containing protein n=1 Tax=Phytophthora kernoviae TaxID=325452 RepID=A0A3R7IFY3_9STRA|nr:hypothetical protein BBI17_004600 [Phytophthora kernoviae]RLN79426.1 hypothetical protein BBO99_00005267 [Phytophthora kernoviae]